MEKVVVYTLAVLVLALSGLCQVALESDDCCPKKDVEACAFCAHTLMNQVPDASPTRSISVRPVVTERPTAQSSQVIAPPTPPPKHVV